MSTENLPPTLPTPGSASTGAPAAPAAHRRQPLFRIWVAGYRDWLPAHWYEVPPTAVALQPAEEGCLAADEARAFLKGFNRRMLAEAKPLWAVALPVSGQFAGDAQSGQSIQGHHFSHETAAAG